MTWLQPWAAWLLAGLPLIVLLYLLKVRRRAVTVSTLLFWRRVIEEHRRRALFQKLRHILSLLLWLLIFALIVAAIARPAFDRLIREGAATVLLIDARARMQAVEADGTTRWDKARAAAKLAIAGVSGSRPMALMTLGPQPLVLSPFTSDEHALRTALERASVTDATGNLSDALEFADSLLATRAGSGHQVILYSDRTPDPSIMRLHPFLTAQSVGSARDNVAILRFATRPLPASPQTSEILVEIANFGVTEVTTNLQIRYDDRLIDVKPVTLASGARETRVFPSVPRPTAGARGHLEARLEKNDALAMDNVARALLPPPKPVRTLLVSKGNVFLEKALSAEAGISYELIVPDVWSPAVSENFDVTVFDDLTPTGWESANALFVGRTPFGANQAPLVSPLLTDTDTAHPILRTVDLSRVTILRGQALALPASNEEWTYEAPVRSFDTPLLVTGEKRGTQQHRVVALGFELAATDLPLRVAFPLLISNAVHWLAGAETEPRLPLRCGDTIRLGVDEQVITTPPTTGFFQPLQNGFYKLEHSRQSEWIAVNTSSEEESHLLGADRREHRQDGGRELPRMAASWLPVWPPWRYLAVAALCLTTVEWALFHGRRTE